MVAAPADTAATDGVRHHSRSTVITQELHAHSPDFGIAGHFVDRIVDVHGVLDHSAVLKHLDLLGHTSDGEVVTVSVKLDAKTQTAM